MSAESFDSWAVLELMGHVRIAGRVTEEERFGAKVGRIDIPTPDGGFVTQYFTAGSIYRMTACTEDAARAVALKNQPTPVHRWELPAPAPDRSSVASNAVFDREGEGEDEDDDFDRQESDPRGYGEL